MKTQLRSSFFCLCLIILFTIFSCSGDENVAPDYIIKGKIVLSDGSTNVLTTSYKGGIKVLQETGISELGGDYTKIGFPNYVSWSPAGDKIMYVHRSSTFIFPFGDSIIILRGNGKVFSKPVASDSTPLHISIRSPVWFPDNKKILYKNIWQKGLQIVGVHGNDPSTILTDFEESIGEFDLSSDGQKLVYTSKIDTAFSNHKLYSIDINGTQHQQLSYHHSDHAYPKWSHDDSQIAFVQLQKMNDPEGDVYIINSDGTNKQFIERGNYPVWSPDDNQLAIRSIHGDLLIIDLQKNNQHHIRDKGIRDIQSLDWH